MRNAERAARAEAPENPNILSLYASYKEIL
jgi:hypothetical protein